MGAVETQLSNVAWRKSYNKVFVTFVYNKSEDASQWAWKTGDRNPQQHKV